MKRMVFPITTEFDAQLPYYFAGVGCRYEQENIVRPMGFPNYQWIQCRNGVGELILNGSKYTIEEGSGMFLFPNEPHEYHSTNGNWEVDWIIFRGKFIDSFVRETLKMTNSGVYYITAPHILSAKLEQLYKTASSDNQTKNLICSSVVYAVLIDILRLTSLKQNTSIVNRFNKITPILSYIENNYANHISLSDIADIAGVTPQYLCAAFKRYTSQTLFEYINMVRIRKSKEYLLLNKDMQIKEIARNVGFGDISYFCATFKKIENMSPTEFRILHN